MLIRIVHMYFTQEGAKKFLKIFGENVKAIQSVPGCTHLELLSNVEDPCHFTTLSHWNSPASLEAYRNSALFKNVWGSVKPLFSGKPLAYSMLPHSRNS